MNNIAIRRSIRKYVKHYGVQDTRKIIKVFAAAWKTSKQRIAGNLKTLKYDDETIEITTIIPYRKSLINI